MGKRSAGGYRKETIFDKLNAVISKDLINFLGFLGALLVFLSPHLNWFSEKTKYGDEVFRESANLFQCSYTLKAGVLKIFGIIIFAIGMFLLLWEIANYISSLKKIRNSISDFAYIEIILAVVALVLMILAFFNRELINSIKEMKQYLDLYESEGYIFHGIGPACGIVGAVISALANLLRRQS